MNLTYARAVNIYTFIHKEPQGGYSSLYILAFWWGYGIAKVEYAVHEYRQNHIKAVLAIQTSSVYFGVL